MEVRRRCLRAAGLLGTGWQADDSSRTGLKALVTWVAVVFVMLTPLFTAAGCAVKVGSVEEFVFDEPLGEQAVTEVVIKMGAGSLDVHPGATGVASGAVRYNVASWKPSVKRSGSRVSIQQGNPKGLAGLGGGIVNEWDVSLGQGPLRLEVNAGAYEGHYELGGLTLGSLVIKDGAAKTSLTFSRPNLGRLERFSYETGASTVNLTGLGNANFQTLAFTGGAGSYTLDFSGQLRSDGEVRVKAGVGKVRLVIPATVTARVRTRGSLNDVSTEGAWIKVDQTYLVQGTAVSGGKSLDIIVEMSVGKLELVAR